MGYYGVGDYVQKIIDLINPRIPTGLPSQWDVTNLQISKVDEAHLKGITINLRAFETEFASL